MANEVAGYNICVAIRARLPHLPHRRRVAFAVACAERVLPLVQNYWGNTGPFGDAVELAWKFAEDGRIDANTAVDVAVACEAAIGELYDDDETGATMRAASSVANALDASREDNFEKAIDAAFEAQSAAEIDDRSRAKEFGTEEAEWQERALEIAASIPIPSREMFVAIAAEPQWLQAYRKEQWIKRS